MSLYPEAQRNAQQELDRVCVDRLPDFSDRGSLPYLSAILNETLRWGNISPFGASHESINHNRMTLMFEEGLPRKTMHDDEYNGYFIPGGSIILGSFVVHDVTEHTNPILVYRELLVCYLSTRKYGSNINYT